MANGTVAERMLDLIEEVCDDEVIREERDIDLFKAGLLDSMAAIELLVGIESEFGEGRRAHGSGARGDELGQQDHPSG